MKRRERLRFRGIVATTDPVKKGGRTYKLTEEQLKKATKTFVGKPILHEHRGRAIGKVEKAWYKDGKVYVEGVIYEPENQKEEEIIKRVEKGEISGLSPSFTFKVPKPPPKKVILHGSLKIVEEKENGTLIVEGKIPEEEIVRKLGSIENLKNYSFTGSWIHDGSPESKKRIEREASKD